MGMMSIWCNRVREESSDKQNGCGLIPSILLDPFRKTQTETVAATVAVTKTSFSDHIATAYAHATALYLRSRAISRVDEEWYNRNAEGNDGS